MFNPIPDVLNAPEAVPAIVITEPSSLIQTSSVTSVPGMEKAVSTTKVTDSNSSEKPAQESKAERSENVAVVMATAEPEVVEPRPGTPGPEQERESSSEFSPAQDFNECVVPVPELQSESEAVEQGAASSETDLYEFRTTSRCWPFNVNCRRLYENLWNIVEHRYAIPFWLALMAIPMSAGIYGSMYMFSCPAADALPNMIFMMGISLLALLSFRVIIIIHRMTWEDESSRSLLQTLNLISLFLSTLFYLTESSIFWRMNHTNNVGTIQYCATAFTTYAYWFNCAVTALFILLGIFPIA